MGAFYPDFRFIKTWHTQINVDSVALTLTQPISGSFHTSHFINLQGHRFPGKSRRGGCLSFSSKSPRGGWSPSDNIYMWTVHQIKSDILLGCDSAEPPSCLHHKSPRRHKQMHLSECSCETQKTTSVIKFICLSGADWFDSHPPPAVQHWIHCFLCLRVQNNLLFCQELWQWMWLGT